MKIDQRLQNFISNHTGRECGLVNAPVSAKAPWYTLIPMPGTELTGSLGQPNSMEEKIYQIDVVGVSPSQCEEAEERLCSKLSAFLADEIPGVMGPPLIRKNGAQPATQQVYHRVVIVRISVTEEEE